MNELGLPPHRPLPDERRERVLRTVLEGLDAPPRRRAAPLVAAAVVVAVLGAATAVALASSSAPEGSQMAPRPAAVPSTAAPAPPVVATPEPDAGPGYVDPLDRCKAAVRGSGREGAYPAVAGWTVTEHILVHGSVDHLLAIDGAFLCHVSPTTVRVSQVAGTAVAGVQVVGVGPDLFGVLNPQGAAVAPTFGTTTVGPPSTAPVQAVQLDDGVRPGDVRLTVRPPGSTGPGATGPLPGAVPDPIVVTDHPLPPRDSSTADGAALDGCVGASQLDRSVEGHAAIVDGDSEPELWQPLVRVELPGGGFALAATIGDDHAGLCVRDGTSQRWWSRQFRSDELLGTSALFLSGSGREVAYFGLSAAVDRVELTRADGGGVPCEIRSRLALCVGDASGLLTLTLFDAAGVPAQMQVSLDDV